MPPVLVRRVMTLVHRIAVDDLGGADQEVPVAGSGGRVRRRLVDPLVGVRAGLLVRDVAAMAMEQAAVDARAAGSSWAQIGAALDLPPAGRGERPEAATTATRAFDLVALAAALDSPELAGRAARCVRWTCRSCWYRITDYGPDERTPDEREAGHAAGCLRRRTALAAYEAGDQR